VVLILYFIPIVGLIVAIINTNDLAKVFGKGVGYTLLMLLLRLLATRCWRLAIPSISLNCWADRSVNRNSLEKVS